MVLRPRALFLLGVIAVGAPSAAAPTPAPMPSTAVAPDAVGATTRWSRNRLFHVSYVSDPSPVPLLAIHSWTITVLDADGSPIPNANVTVLGGMPAHGHGLPTTPQVKNLGNGRYLVEGLKFHMPGDWVVGFRIKSGAGIDSVNFDLHFD